MTVIIPFHRTLEHLARSLPAARRSLPDAEIIVAADGAREDGRHLAAASNARVIDLPGPAGPAVARNRAAAEATGDVLVFVDADVVAAPDALGGLCGLLERETDVAAVFGAYGLHPPERNFMSQYRNLAHAFVHETAQPEATTFWAGLGAVRAQAFRAVGGFDERFRRPSVEDIDLGYRLRRAGCRIRLDPRFRGEHLKRWTLWSSVVTDVVARGVPWTQLILKYGALTDDLNTRQSLRWSVGFTWLAALALVAALVTPWAAVVALAALVAVAALNRTLSAWLVQQRGFAFASRVFFVHLLHHFGNGVSLAAGTLLYAGARLGVRLPGALPLTGWPR